MDNGIAVFGIGGAGCKIIRRLDGAIRGECRLIAVDKNESELEPMGEGIQRVVVGPALAGSDNSEAVKEALNEEIGALERSLEGVEMAIALVGLGGKTGTLLSGFISELCRKKNIFTLFILIYPLTKTNGFKSADSTVRKMRERADGVIIVDNNLKKEGGRLPMIQVFARVNSMIKDLVLSLISSLSLSGPANLGAGELREFFRKDLFFILTSASEKSLDESCKHSMGELSNYAEGGNVERVLMIASAPSEINKELRERLNGMVSERYSPDYIKWITAYGDDIRLLMISGVRELPLVEGVEMPPEISAPQEQANWGNVEEKGKRPAEGGETDNKGLISGGGDSDRENNVIAGISGAGISGEENEERGNSMSGGSEEKDAKDVLEGDVDEENASEEADKEIGEDTDIGEDADIGEDTDIGEEASDIIDAAMAGGREAQDTGREKGLYGISQKPSYELPKSQALIGMREEKPTEMKEGAEDSVQEESDDIDDVVNELIGFPATKKKGQKRLDDYEDFGIGYI